MTSGVLMFAHNNREIDYGMMAYVSARYVDRYLKVPVSLITDSGTINWLDKKDTGIRKSFDKIILTDELPQPDQQDKRFYDGSIDYKKTAFKNGFRTRAYDLTPYEQTLVIDTDVLIKNDRLKNIWKSNADFMINSKHIDIACTRNNDEFKRVSEYTIDIAIIENKPYFIEINCFGKEYAAGSSLFHWLIDEDILYGKKSDKIYFRYAIE